MLHAVLYVLSQNIPKKSNAMIELLGNPVVIAIVKVRMWYCNDLSSYWCVYSSRSMPRWYLLPRSFWLESNTESV